MCLGGQDCPQINGFRAPYTHFDVLCVYVQDLSYLKAGPYAALMQDWLRAAKPLTPILQAAKVSLKAYCNATQPPDPDQSDVYLTYKDNADFERLGRELPPMLFSVSGGVSQRQWRGESVSGSLVEAQQGTRVHELVWGRVSPGVASNPRASSALHMLCTAVQVWSGYCFTCEADLACTAVLCCTLQAQIPRSVYNATGHGVVIVRCRQRRLFLVRHAG